MEMGAGKVGSALNRMVDSFSGRKIIQDATLATEAVERIGGVSRLTERELARVGATATEAAAKMRSLGQDVPPGIQKIADAAKRADDAMGKATGSAGSWKASLLGAASALGVVFSAQAVIGFVGKVFNAASAIHDMSLQLGISAEATQGFKFAAEQAGSSLDAVGTAITKMNQHLAVGDKSTVAALRAAGLSFADIRAMKPEDAFLAITDAVAKIPDPMVQSRVALELFGKGAAELLPAIKEGFRSTADAANKMSNDTIASLEKAQDAWGKLADSVTIFSGTIIAHTMSVTTHATSSWRQFFQFVENSVKFGAGTAVAMADIAAAADIAAKSALKVPVALGAIPPALGPIAAGVSKVRTEMAALQTRQDALFGRDLIARAQQMASDLVHVSNLTLVSAEKSRELHQAMSGALSVYDRMGKVAPKAMLDIWTATLKLEDGVVIVDGLAQALKDVGVQAKIASVELPKFPPVISGIGDAMKGMGVQVALTDIGIKKVSAGVAELAASLQQLAQIGGGAFGPILQGIASIISGLDAAQKANARYQGNAGIASGLFSSDASKSEQWAAGIASAGAVASGALNVWNSTAGSANDAMKALTGAMGGAQAGAMFGPWGAAIGAATGALTGFLRGALGVTEYEKRVRGAATETTRLQQTLLSTHGGMQQLVKDAAAVGINITEAFRWQDPEALARVIEDLNEKTAALGITATATGDAQAAAIQKARDAVGALDDQIKSLSDSIAGEAPEEFMGIIEAQTRAQIAAIQKERNKAQEAIDNTLKYSAEAGAKAGDIIDAALRERLFVIRVKAEIDGLPGGTASGTGLYTPPRGGGGTGSGGDTVTVAPIYMDSLKVAEALVTLQKRVGG